MFDFGLEKWYPILREHTFESEWLDLTWDEVRPIIRTRSRSSECRIGRAGERARRR